jgi:hypothetical protein
MASPIPRQFSLVMVRVARARSTPRETSCSRAPEDLRLTDHEQCGLRQSFEDGKIAFIEGEGMRRKYFDETDDVSLVTNRGRGDRTDA